MLQTNILLHANILWVEFLGHRLRFEWLRPFTNAVICCFDLSKNIKELRLGVAYGLCAPNMNKRRAAAHVCLCQVHQDKSKDEPPLER